jgi:putative transposase
MDTLPKRKYIRLAPEIYANPHEIFFLTIDAFERRQYFTVPEFNDAVLAKLRELALHHRCPVKIYCLLPTHLHLLISAGTISVIDWVARFKQYSQHMARQRGIAQLWQRSFHDHRMRPKENIADAIEYIRANPVRAGLVNHPDDWRWTGSVELDVGAPQGYSPTLKPGDKT